MSEVEVTSKSGDGGIDLKAVKNWLVELNNNDFVKYKVQAKRYKPSTTMPPDVNCSINTMLALFFNSFQKYKVTGTINKSDNK